MRPNLSPGGAGFSALRSHRRAGCVCHPHTISSSGCPAFHWGDRIVLQAPDLVDDRLNAGFVHAVKTLQFFLAGAAIAICQSTHNQHHPVEPGQVPGDLPTAQGHMLHMRNQVCRQAIGNPIIQFRSAPAPETLNRIVGLFMMVAKFAFTHLWKISL